MTPMDEWNRAAVKGLLADAERVLALTEFEDVRGNREIVEKSIAKCRKDYTDLVRRSKPLIMTDGEYETFQSILERLKARLRFFGESRLATA